MKTLFKRSFLVGTVLALLTAFSQTAIAQTTLGGNLTVDNEVTAYLSTADNVAGTAIPISPADGSDTVWQTASGLTPTALTPGNDYFLHVEAVDTGVIAMFLGSFTLSDTAWKFANNTQSLVTGTADWMVNPVAWGDGSAAAPVLVTDPAWTAVDWVSQGIDASADFIWDTANTINGTLYFSAAIVRSEADIAVSANNISGPVVVSGSGVDNYNYTMTVTNNGPDQATNLVMNLLSTPTGGPIDSNGCTYVAPGTTVSWPNNEWTIGTLDSGSSVILTATCTILATTPHNATLDHTVSLKSMDQVDGTVGNDSDSVFTTFIRQATWDVTKVWDGGEVNVQLTCGGLLVDSVDTVSKTATLTYTGFADGVNCVVTETVPVGEAPNYVGDCDVASTVSGNGYSCRITNSTSEVRIHATKAFSDLSDDEVTINVNCNDGFISQDGTAQVAPGPIGHTFIITDFTDGALDCTVTEGGSPSGYTTTPVLGYEFLDMFSATGVYEASFFNAAKDATYTVTKDWMITGAGGNAVEEEVYVTIECNAPIDQVSCSAESKIPCAAPTAAPPTINFTKSGWLGDGDMLVASVSTYRGDAMCKAYEDIVQSGVDSDNGCASYTTLSAGEKYGCTITNTVFFEGIPTLNQYGMAIMALLMLGLGFVGFRRFV